MFSVRYEAEFYLPGISFMFSAITLSFPYKNPASNGTPRKQQRYWGKNKSYILYNANSF